MDESQVPLEADLQFDEVVLSDRAFNADPSQILIESSDPQKLRFRLIEWLAEAPNRKVKAERKKKISETLGISIRQVERLVFTSRQKIENCRAHFMRFLILQISYSLPSDKLDI